MAACLIYRPAKQPKHQSFQDRSCLYSVADGVFLEFFYSARCRVFLNDSFNGVCIQAEVRDGCNSLMMGCAMCPVPIRRRWNWLMFFAAIEYEVFRKAI